MFAHPLQQVEAMVADDRSMESIEDFIEDIPHVSEEFRSALWLLAWSETSRENRGQRVAELIAGRRQVAGPVRGIGA